MSLITPVEYGKLKNMAPQIIYSYIKRGMPTHEAEHKGKMRQLVDAEECNQWLEVYEQTKSHGRRNATTDENGEEVRVTSGVKAGQYIVSQGGVKVRVSQVSKSDEHFLYVQQNAYAFPFVLNKTTKLDRFLTHDAVRIGLREGKLLLETPLQILDMALSYFEGIRPELGKDMREVLRVHLEAMKDEIEAFPSPEYYYKNEEPKADEPTEFEKRVASNE